MNTFINLKKVIELGKMSNEEILVKMDVFLLNDRIDPKQYQELVNLMGIEIPEETPTDDEPTE